MATQQQVLETHRQHPDWSAIRIAQELDCTSAYVRATGQRLKIALPPSRPDSIEALGNAAREAGLSVMDLQTIAKLKSPALAAAVAISLICASAIAGYVAGGSL